MTTERIVSYAQIGIANHGRTIVNGARDAGNLRLMSCFDINLEANRQIAEEFHAFPASSYEEALNYAGVEAVVLVTPNHLHYEQLRLAVQAEKHLFVDKPIANTVRESREMIAWAKQANLILMVGHNTRRRQSFRRAKQLLDENRIGTVVAVEANLSRPAGLQAGLPAWKADSATCPLLPMMQLGIHLVDTVEYLLDPIATVSCIAANRAMKGSAYDTTTALLQLESGIPVTLSSYYVSADTYFLRIYGTAGTLHCFPTKLQLDLLENGMIKETITEEFNAEGAQSYILQMKEFGDCILHGKKPETGGPEGLRAVAVIEAMTASVEHRCMVQLEKIE
ncbi:MAG: Gfo/Idh/MocA family oxidoreductase [bacterium]